MMPSKTNGYARVHLASKMRRPRCGAQDAARALTLRIAPAYSPRMPKTPRLAQLFILATLFVAACSDQGDGGPSVTSQDGDLRVLPAALVRDAAPGQELREAYRLERYAAGAWTDVTDGASFQLEGGLGAHFEDAELVFGGYAGGQGRVVATAGAGGTAQTSVTIRLVEATRDESLSELPVPVAEALAWDPTTGSAVTPGTLQLAYPEDGVLVPPNLSKLELHWFSDVPRIFRVAVRSGALELQHDLRCERAGCQFRLPKSWFHAMAESHGGAEDGPRWSVRGVKDDGTDLLVSDEREILLTDQLLKGAIYYWRAEPGQVLRTSFGSEEDPEIFVGAAGVSMNCVGCHTVSRNGEKVAVGKGVPFPATIDVLDVGTGDKVAGTAGNFMAFAPDGAALVRTRGNELVIDTWDGVGTLTTEVVADKGSMPTWSPDGARIVYVDGQSFSLPGFSVDQLSFTSGRLKMIWRMGTGWSPPVDVLTTTGPNDFYPDYGPEADWVVFNRSQSNQGSFEAPDAELWLGSATTGVSVKLARASGFGMSSWPKFAPFAHDYRGHRLAWVSFSTRRRYGSYSNATAGEYPAQLWIAAVDLDRAATGEDPSFPAFWFPHQDVEAGNHLAQWATSLIKKTGAGGN